MNRKISIGAAIALIIVSIALTVSVTMVVAMRQFNYKLKNVNQRQAMFDYITEVDNAIRRNYVGEISEEELRTALAKGYLNGIGDPYAEYLTPAEYKTETERLAGSCTGLGLEIAEQADDSLIITAVHKNSAADTADQLDLYAIADAAADKAGVQKGDVITALDGSETDYSAVAGRLSSGEKAMITVKRGEESIAFELSASTYTATTVESRLINTTGYIRIRSFYSNTPEQFKAAMTALEEQGAQNFVFDLRNNEGGTLTAVSDILGYLLPRGTYARRVETAGAVSDLTSEGTHELSQSSVTLVNETTAGEAELFAGVLQEFKKTTVVGMSTKGRGKIQAFYNVTSDGSAIKVSIASLSLLEGGEIEGKGVTPDQTVALTADQESRFEFLTEEDDPQLKTALSVLNNTIVTPPTTTTTGSGASTTTTVQPAS